MRVKARSMCWWPGDVVGLARSGERWTVVSSFFLLHHAAMVVIGAGMIDEWI
jgi:hypothetical protein